MVYKDKDLNSDLEPDLSLKDLIYVITAKVRFYINCLINLSLLLKRTSVFSNNTSKTFVIIRTSF
jgi:hypothetical protein